MSMGVRFLHADVTGVTVQDNRVEEVKVLTMCAVISIPAIF